MEIVTLVFSHLAVGAVGILVGSNAMKRRIEKELDKLFDEIKSRQPK